MALKLIGLEEAVGIARRAASSIDLGSEQVHVTRCVGRVLSEDVTAPHDLPRFDVAALDGYATRWEFVAGASVISPRFLRVTESPVAEPFAVRVRTGERMPEGTDTVIPKEAARPEGDLIRVVEGLERWRNVDRAGSFFAKGSVVLRRGRVLRPLDIPVLSQMGIETVRVVRRPRTRFVSIVSGRGADDGRSVRNDYSYALAETLSWLGADVREVVMVEAEAEAVEEAVRSSLGKFDLIVTVGSASVGEGDVVRSAYQRIERAEVLFHGVNVHPGKPTGLVVLGGRALWLILPASIVAALAGAVLIGGAVIRSMLGLEGQGPKLRARCGARIEGRPGTPSVVFFSLTPESSGELVAAPLGKGVNNLFVAMNADACAVVPPGSAISESERIEVTPVRPFLFC